MSQVRNSSVSSLRFVQVYVSMALAGKSAKEIAAELYGVPVESVTKSQIANVTQKSTNLRKLAKEAGKPDDFIPTLKRGRVTGSGKDTGWMDVVASLNPPKTETPPSDVVAPDAPDAPKTEETPVS